MDCLTLPWAGIVKKSPFLRICAYLKLVLRKGLFKALRSEFWQL